MTAEQLPVVGPCAPAVGWAEALATLYTAPPEWESDRLAVARSAYLAGDWDALERALNIGDVPDGPSVTVAELRRRPL